MLVTPEDVLQRVAGPPADAVRTETLTLPAANSAVQKQARAYVAKMPPAIAGQHGHDQTFSVACRLVIGFGLTPEEAMPTLKQYNRRCEPPWSESELWKKLYDAEQRATETGESRGDLRLNDGKTDDKYAGWPPLDGGDFIGYLPDFADASAADVYCLLHGRPQFCGTPWHKWVEVFMAWTKLVAVPLIHAAMVSG